MPDISVIILTYNSPFQKLAATLTSVINQKSIDFDIIVADDGSANFEYEKIVQWFGSHNFSKYQIVNNKINRGTVWNALSGIQIARGTYIKQLSPGDFLYDSSTLRSLLDYMHTNNFDLCFGRTASYQIDPESKQIRLADYCAPKNIEPYLSNNLASIRYQYLVNRDYANGMSFLVKRDLLMQYMKRIVGKVKYAEDCSYILMIAAGIEIHYWNDYVIWYECGTGISTAHSTNWGKRLFEDNRICYSILKKDFPEWEKAYTINFQKGIRYYFHKLHKKMIKSKADVADHKPDINILHDLIQASQ